MYYNMKEIKLTRGLTTKVDDTDYHWLNQWNWYALKTEYGYYAARSTGILMHRVIMNTPDDMLTDHSNRDTLDNQRHNLRNANRSQNGTNCKPRGKSKYLGVSKLGERCKSYSGKYLVKISVNKKRIHIGYFDDEEYAARKYDEYAKKYYGEFANLNFK